MAKKIDLTGQRFGKLLVLYEAPKIGDKIHWMCKCECGNKKEVIGWHLTQGIVSSCGCLISKGEAKIQELLLAAKIPFKT